MTTGVYTSNGAQRDFFSDVQPHPALPGNWYRLSASYALSPDADIDRSCPRMSHESNFSETIFLMPNAYNTGSAQHRVSRYKDSLGWPRRHLSWAGVCRQLVQAC